MIVGQAGTVRPTLFAHLHFFTFCKGKKDTTASTTVFDLRLLLLLHDFHLCVQVRPDIIAESIRKLV